MDRLSALPDSLLHHILSLLPSTKQAIQTGILSKRWHNQWTYASTLIFDFTDFSLETTSAISRVIDQTLILNRCSRIQKFQITDDLYNCAYDPTVVEKIRFVDRKQVEELVLKFSINERLRLPEFIFTQSSLVKLWLSGCSIMPTGMVNWGNLKDLYIECCSCPDEVITSMVSGSPLLQSLELRYCSSGYLLLVIASNSLKRLVVCGVGCYAKISCPNLVEFHVYVSQNKALGRGRKAFEKFLSDSPLLESLKILSLFVPDARIASKILKKLVLKCVVSDEIEISCPHLEELCLGGRITTLRLMNLSSSVCASLDLVYPNESQKAAVKQILESVQHISELKLGDSFIKTLSALETAGVSLNCKSLTVKGPRFDPKFPKIPGIVFALGSSPMLERLVVKLRGHEYSTSEGHSVLDHSKENRWISFGARFSSLVSQLRTVEIIGFSQREKNLKCLLDFVEFLLKNANPLERIVVVLKTVLLSLSWKFRKSCIPSHVVQLLPLSCYALSSYEYSKAAFLF